MSDNEDKSILSTSYDDCISVKKDPFIEHWGLVANLNSLVKNANLEVEKVLGVENAFRLLPPFADADGNVTDDTYVISGIYSDTRFVRADTLFVAIRGAHVDSHQFVPALLERAIAVMVDALYYEENKEWLEQVDHTPVIVVPNTLRFAPFLVDQYFNRPTKWMNVIGVTGTNGKTTTTHLIESILNAAPIEVPPHHVSYRLDYETGERKVEVSGDSWSQKPPVVGILGTISHRAPKMNISAVNTTPDNLTLQRYLCHMTFKDVTDVVMETSSHALEEPRLERIRFDIVVFTNLTQDHLDFHGTMENYGNAKKRLFDDFVRYSIDEGKSPVAVINIDDPFGRGLVAVARSAGAEVITYAIDSQADLRARNIRYQATGTTFDLVSSLCGEEISHEVTIPLIGKFNVSNVLASVGAALASNRHWNHIVAHLPHLPQVPGRLQRVGTRCFVDYAHAPDAIESILKTLRPLLSPKTTSEALVSAHPEDDTDVMMQQEKNGELYIVIGAGGDRDKTKRPLMGEIAARLADHVIITNDNPRFEDPIDIARAVEEGALAAKNATVKVVLDRAEAIAEAIGESNENDIVVIAGKGHETYQDIHGERHHFSDVEVVEKVLGQIGE